MIDVTRPTVPAPLATAAACAGTCACGVEPLAHPKYSFGMLLEPGSLSLEHNYHALRANTHNIRLHDFGTVCGLRVEQHPSPQCVNTYAILRPGIALDCCGREIVVPEDLFVPLYDGATSGWCGAGMGSTSASTAPTTPPPAKLYVYLRYAQCDTDPIPTYVRPCGCCGPCDHGDCTPSVTREGYEISVSSTAPTDWANPVGKAFCEWLEVKLKGPGSSAPLTALAKRTLEDVLCDAVTAPCADFCSPANDLLLLATVNFDATGKLTGIDNVTGRRIVISTGALFDAVACLTLAEIACCAKATAANLALTAEVSPTSVVVHGDAAKGQLTYTVTVTNAADQPATGGFAIHLAFPANVLEFDSATLDVTGSAPSTQSGDDSGITVGLGSLAPGAIAKLEVKASYREHQGGDTITSVASIEDYSGSHDPDQSATTTFISETHGQ